MEGMKSNLKGMKKMGRMLVSRLIHVCRPKRYLVMGLLM